MPLDPFRANIFIDSCAFDPKYEPESSCSAELFRRYENGDINLVVAHSNMKEIEHPNTPAYVKQEASAKTYSCKVHLTQQEHMLRDAILDTLSGNGKRERMMPDSNHIFEAHKYGGYFVTTDHRILKKKRELHSICNAIVVTPSAMLKLINQFEGAYSLEPDVD